MQDAGIKVNDIPINNIKNADNTVLIAEAPENPQILINKIVECSKNTDHQHNKNNGKYNYLGTVINDSSEEIRIRVEKAKQKWEATFTKLKKVTVNTGNRYQEERSI